MAATTELHEQKMGVDGLYSTRTYSAWRPSGGHRVHPDEHPSSTKSASQKAAAEPLSIGTAVAAFVREFRMMRFVFPVRKCGGSQ